MYIICCRTDRKFILDFGNDFATYLVTILVNFQYCMLIRFKLNFDQVAVQLLPFWPCYRAYIRSHYLSGLNTYAHKGTAIILLHSDLYYHRSFAEFLMKLHNVQHCNHASADVS